MFHSLIPRETILWTGIICRLARRATSLSGGAPGLRPSCARSPADADILQPPVRSLFSSHGALLLFPDVAAGRLEGGFRAAFWSVLVEAQAGTYQSRNH